MLLKIENYDRLDGRKLMDLYRGSNVENVDCFYPDAEDREEALRKVERNFLSFLWDDFLPSLEVHTGFWKKTGFMLQDCG